MIEPVCQNCQHFYRHYIIDSQRCTPVNCGHCCFPGLKRRKPDDKGCVHFLAREEPVDLPDRRGVIDFLTKEMLEHILTLNLPPEVDEDEGFDKISQT